jgi:PAS domain S-box-containing protein
MMDGTASGKAMKLLKWARGAGRTIGRPKTISAIVSSLALIALLALAVWWVPREQRDADRWVEHTHAVMSATAVVLSALQNAESSQRGYLLTADASYLTAYETSAAATRVALTHLRELTSDNPHQQPPIAEVGDLADARLAELAAVVEQVRRGDIAGAVAKIRIGTGRRTMNTIRDRLSAISDEEEGLLTARRARQQREELFLQITIGVFGLGMIGSFIGLTFVSIQGAADNARRESEAQFRTLADRMPTLCWMAHADGSIFWYNRGWYEYTGTTPDQMEGWGWQTVHDPAVLPQVLERWNHSIATGEDFEMIFPLKAADGTFRTFLTRITPLLREDGAVLRWFGANTDISAEQRHSQEMEQLVEVRTAALLREVEERRVAQEALRQGEKLQLVGQLTGGIAHDFNNFLQVFTSGVALLRSARLSDERKETVLDSMERRARETGELISRLLSFAHKQPIDPRSVNLNEQLTANAELLRRALGSKIEVRTDIPNDLWPVRADPSQFDMVLLNLAVNARDAMPTGGVLTLRGVNEPADGANGWIRVIVEDTGTGMSPAVLKRVFEPFFTTKKPGEGTGLGLWQVQCFVQLIGGGVTAESTVGVGTKIILRLPRASSPDLGRDVPLAISAISSEAIARASGKVVLVVDDNPEVAAFGAAMLEGLGYTVLQAATAPEALTQLESGIHVDAVFTDVVMPGEIDGAALAAIVTERFPGVAVVVATGYSSQLDRLRKLQLELLAKPYLLEDLAAALERALGRLGEKLPPDQHAPYLTGSRPDLV